MKIYCYTYTLVQLAKKAAQTKDPEDIRKHKEYEQMCLRDDVEVICNVPSIRPR